MCWNYLKSLAFNEINQNVTHFRSRSTRSFLQKEGLWILPLVLFPGYLFRSLISRCILGQGQPFSGKFTFSHIIIWPMIFFIISYPWLLFYLSSMKHSKLYVAFLHDISSNIYWVGFNLWPCIYYDSGTLGTEIINETYNNNVNVHTPNS